MAHHQNAPMMASQAGDLTVVQRCIRKRGVQPDRPDVHGQTALYLSSEGGHFAVVKILLEHGADANKVRYNGSGPLFAASQNGCVNSARLLLESGASVNHATIDGYTPIHAACMMGQLESVRLLLESGADSEQSAHDGTTPYQTASEQGHDALVELLREHAVTVARGLEVEALRAPPETGVGSTSESEARLQRRAIAKRTCVKCGEVVALTGPTLLRSAGCHCPLLLAGSPEGALGERAQGGVLPLMTLQSPSIYP